MPVTIICPSCSKPVVVHIVQTSKCALCGEDFPEPLLKTLRGSIVAEAHFRPLTLTFAMFIALTIGVGMCSVVVLVLLDMFTYTFDGEQLAGIEFLRMGGAILGIAGLVLISAAYGLWRERPWSRLPLIFFWLVAAAALIPPNIKIGNMFGILFWGIRLGVGVAITAGYLYGSSSVGNYYAKLRSNSIEP